MEFLFLKVLLIFSDFHYITAGRIKVLTFTEASGIISWFYSTPYYSEQELQNTPQPAKGRELSEVEFQTKGAVP